MICLSDISFLTTAMAAVTDRTATMCRAAWIRRGTAARNGLRLWIPTWKTLQGSQNLPTAKELRPGCGRRAIFLRILIVRHTGIFSEIFVKR
ncbi:hypothetical protein IMSAGC018_00112 [Lachnospiraceae bacterium]|nr:hypothetical protein IMSAGC018_00112 [Lachnospiraceae bacterium]